VGPDDTSVSRVHAEIVLTAEGTVVVRDAKSRNGTYVGNERLSGERPLAKGDHIRLGPEGPELVIRELLLPGEAAPAKAKPKPKPAPAAAAKAEERAAAKQPSSKPPAPSAADRAAAKMGAPRRSFGGKGATVFFSEMFHETSKKSARRVRIAVWSAVVVVAAAVAAGYWYKDRIERQLEQRLAEQQALADSVRLAATAEYQRLSRELEAARAGSAPAAVVESLRVALGQAEARTAALEEALARAQASLQEQLAAGDSIRQLAQNELTQLQSELDRARAAGTSGALLDSLRRAVQAAEDRATQIASQVRAVRGGNLAAVAQANQSAVGLVTAYVGESLFDGSGFAISPSGYFVTNRHVIQPSGQPSADSVYVTLADQRTMRRARVVRAAAVGGPDLAVLQIVGYDGPHVARMDWTGTNVRQGEPAALIGFPAGYGNALDESGAVRTTMTAGIFAKVTSDVINFDGFSVGGSSGSPIFNSNGEVVGVHRAGLSEAVGMGFAVPIPMLVPLLPPEVKRELGLQ
jgi:S1-C subfamily serine protease